MRWANKKKIDFWCAVTAGSGTAKVRGFLNFAVVTSRFLPLSAPHNPNVVLVADNHDLAVPYTSSEH